MVAIRIRAEEACDPQPNLLWDSVWVQRLDGSGGYADWIMAGAGDQPQSRGGLRAEAALHTATMICLFTDRRLPADQTNPADDGDPRGWWGDSIRLDGEPEGELGSLLWTLERGTLDERTALLAKDYAAEALEVIARQGAVARTDIDSVADPVRGRLMLSVRHYSADGSTVYDQRFAVLWQQERQPKPMNFGDRSLVF